MKFKKLIMGETWFCLSIGTMTRVCWKYETQFYWCVKVFLSHGKEWLGKSCHSSQPTSTFKVVLERFVHSVWLTNKLIVVSIICVL